MIWQARHGADALPRASDHRRLDQLSQDHEQDQREEDGKVEHAEVRHHLPDRSDDRFGHIIENFSDLRAKPGSNHEKIARANMSRLRILSTEISKLAISTPI